MKKYIDAKLQIVRTDNCDIVTTSAPKVTIGGKYQGDASGIDAPGRRSIWD